MKNHALLIATAIASAGVCARGQDLGRLPASTQLLARFDVPAIARLLDVDELLRHAEGKSATRMRQLRQRLRDRFDFELLRDVHSVTLFGDRLKGGPFGVLLVTDDRGAAIVREVAGDGDRVRSLHSERVAEALGVEHAGRGEELGAVYLHRFGDDRHGVLFGETRDSIEGAARALRGRAPGIGDGEYGDSIAPADDALVSVRLFCSLRALAGGSTASKVVDRVQAVVADLRAVDGELQLTAHVATANDEDARNIAAVLDGIRGLASLAGLGDEVPEAAREAITGLRTRVDDSVLTLEFALHADAVQEALDGRLELKLRAEQERRRRR